MVISLVLKLIYPGADLSGKDLNNADFYNANLSNAFLSNADLTGANLKGADLSNANLSGAVLSDADLNNIKITKDTNFDMCDFENIKHDDIKNFKTDLEEEAEIKINKIKQKIASRYFLQNNFIKNYCTKYNTLKKELKQYGIAYENKYNVCDINIIFNSMNENERKKIQNILSEYRKKN